MEKERVVKGLYLIYYTVVLETPWRRSVLYRDFYLYSTVE